MRSSARTDQLEAQALDVRTRALVGCSNTE
jgi:hypothetical protein